jgi:hypothetical protein
VEAFFDKNILTLRNGLYLLKMFKYLKIRDILTSPLFKDLFSSLFDEINAIFYQIYNFKNLTKFLLTASVVTLVVIADE